MKELLRPKNHLGRLCLVRSLVIVAAVLPISLFVAYANNTFHRMPERASAAVQKSRRILTYGLHSINSMTPRGDRKRHVTHPNRGQYDYQAHWTASGNRIIFARSTETSLDLFIADRRGHGLVRLTKTPAWAESAPVPNPTRPEVAYVRRAGGTNESTIRLMNLRHPSRTHRLTPSAPETDDPTWAPDGGRLAFVKAKEGETDIYIVRRNGQQRRVTQSPGKEWGVDWSPDGRRLAYAYNPSRSDSIFLKILNLRSGRKRTIGPRPSIEGGNSWPVWSPNGHRLLFFRNGVKHSNFGLWRIRADGNAARHLGEGIPTDWR